MKRALSFWQPRELGLVVAGTGLIAGTYGLVRLAYGLYLSDIEEELGFGAAAGGYISSGASVAYCVGALVGLLLGDRPRRLVLGAAATASVGAAGMALAPGTAGFVPAAVLSSAGAGLASPALVGVVGRSVSRRVEQAQAVVNSGTGPGLVFAGALALVLLPNWRLGLTVGAAFTVVAAVAVLRLDRPSGGPDPVADDPAPSWRWLKDLRTPAAGALLLGAASAAVWTYGRSHLVAEGVGVTASTVAWIAVGVGGTATALTAGWTSGLRPTRAWTLTSGGVALTIGVLAVSAGHLALALVTCLLFGWAFVAATSALIAWAAELVPERAAAGTATLFIMLTAGQALGSTLVGTVADRIGYAAGFGVAALVGAIGACCGQLRASRRASAGCT